MIRFIVALIGLGLAIWVFGALGFRFNLTESLPPGVYRTTFASPTRGSIIQVCLPRRVAEFARERGYLGPGNCPADVRPMGKIVLAAEGDVVRLEAEALHVNGEVIANSRTATQDSQGRPVPHHPRGVYRLGPGEFWLFSDHPSAYDSRYFGPVYEANVIAVLKPPRYGRGARSALAWHVRCFYRLRDRINPEYEKCAVPQDSLCLDPAAQRDCMG